MIRCPECGAKLDLAEMGLSERQRQIRDVIERLKRQSGKWPPAWQIGVEMKYSDRMMRYELKHMEHLGVVFRPNGPRSGWAVRRGYLTVIRAA